MKVAYIFPPPWDQKYPPYAMALFEGSTKHHGHNFFGFDLNVDLFHAVSEEDKKLWDGQYSAQWAEESDRIIQQYSGFLDAYITNILQFNITLYAVYTSLCSKQIALFIARKIKERNPNSAIILGGPQCFPAYDGLKILENKCVDAICTGEGDLVWPMVLDSFSQKGNLQIDVPGIAYKTCDGAIVDGGVPELVTDLNTIPFPDYGSFDFPKYGAREGEYYQISTMTSRGCINTCAFCSDRPSSYRYRHRSAENIVEEIVKHMEVLQRSGKRQNGGSQSQLQSEHRSFADKLLFQAKKVYSLVSSGREASRLQFLKWGHNNRIMSENANLPAQSKKEDPKAAAPYVYISFNDSLVNGSPRELEKFCDMVIERGIKFKWGGMALLRKEMTTDLLNKMKESGCHNLAWGLESGCQDVLNLMHKRFFTMDLAKQIIKNTHHAGIRQSISIIVGFPGETEEMFQETVGFLGEYKSYFERIGTQTMKIYQNSVVHDKYHDFGLDYENAQEFAKWRTIDGMNDYETRVKRLDILKSVLDDQIITIDK